LSTWRELPVPRPTRRMGNREIRAGPADGARRARERARGRIQPKRLEIETRRCQRHPRPIRHVRASRRSVPQEGPGPPGERVGAGKAVVAAAGAVGGDGRESRAGTPPQRQAGPAHVLNHPTHRYSHFAAEGQLLPHVAQGHALRTGDDNGRGARGLRRLSAPPAASQEASKLDVFVRSARGSVHDEKVERSPAHVPEKLGDEPVGRSRGRGGGRSRVSVTPS